MHVVVISGPIASGKSTLSRAVAVRLQERFGIEGAVIDLDLIYEMLDPQGRPKADTRTWSAARRVAGRLATALLAEGRPIVAEGDFAGEGELPEFLAEKRRVDPSEKLVNGWYRHYRSLFSRDPCETRWNQA